MQEIFESLRANDLLTLFLILSVGYLAATLKFRTFSLGSASILFVGIAAGALGFQLNPNLSNLGLALFIYAIGLQAGPGMSALFLSRHGLVLNALALGVTTLAFALTLLLKYVAQIDPVLLAGIYAGSFTSASGFASVMSLAPRFSTHTEPAFLASLGFGIAYPFGVVCVILSLQLAHKLLRVNNDTEETRYREDFKRAHPDLISRAYIVANKILAGKALSETTFKEMTGGAVISRVIRGPQVFSPTTSLTLLEGDKVVVLGESAMLERAEVILGSPMDQPPLWGDGPLQVHSYLVTNHKVVNKLLSEVNVTAIFGAKITRIRRGEVDLLPNPHVRFHFGDRVVMIATDEQDKQLAQLFGNSDKALDVMDFIPYCLGLLIGVFASFIRIPLPGGASFPLGITLGVLLSSILLSQIGKTGPIIWRVPESSNRLLKQFGLSLFLAGVGVTAGASIARTSVTPSLLTLLIPPLIITLPLILMALLARLYRVNFLEIAGIISGGTTSSPGLVTATEITRSEIPTITYALVYPLCLVAVIVYCHLILFF